MIAINKWCLAVACFVILCVGPTIHAQDRTIVIGGTVVTPQRVIPKGWLVIRQGRVSQILETKPNEPNAVVLDTSDIIFPGFIDLHNHPLYAVFERWQPAQKFRNRYEWRESAEYRSRVGTPGSELQRDEVSFCDLSQFAEVMALTGGTTTLSSFFGRRPPDPPIPACFSHLAVRKLESQTGFYEAEPGQERVTQVLGVTPRDLSDANAEETNRRLNGNELDLMLIHVAEGTAGDLESSLEFSLLKWRQFLGPKTGIIHGVAFGRNDFRSMRNAGAGLIWSPRSNIELYNSTTDVVTAFREGVSIALAPDWSPTGSNNMLAELKYAAQYNRNKLNGFFSPQQLFEMATSIPARIARIDDKVGAIQNGLFADVFLLRGDTTKPFDALVNATPGDVDLVLVRGVPVYGSATLMSSFGGTTEQLEICRETKKLNLDIMPNGKLADAQQRIAQRLQAYKLTLAPIVESCAR